MNKLKKKKKISTASRLKSKSQPGKRPINFKVFNNPKKKTSKTKKEAKKERKKIQNLSQTHQNKMIEP